LRAILPIPPRSTLLPYTTLFRSRGEQEGHGGDAILLKPASRSLFRWKNLQAGRPPSALDRGNELVRKLLRAHLTRKRGVVIFDRSEEHTSELQSRVDLVCRLLLE